ncbi:ribosomal protein S25 [Paraburkholderia sp. Clong3]|uniref:DNA translocase FtsK n=1 Tax=Paraburkholderia sp. Clong3 TaxID=2991061 RepID=UPI003D21DEEE
MSHSEEHKAVLDMTAATVGKDLLSATVLELKMLPDVWVKLSETKQNDIIDRLRKRVENAVKMAVHLIASDGRMVVAGDLEQITIKDGAKAVIKVGKSAPSLHELYDAQGKQVLIVVSDAGEHTGGMDEVRGENDQRGLDLGGEYTAEDGDGMNGPSDDDDVVDAEFRPVAALGDGPLQSEIDEQHEAGRNAAADGLPESECPVMRGDLCIAWVKGWKSWHEEQADAAESHDPVDELFEQAAALVREHKRATISFIQRHLKIGYNRAAIIIEQLEKRGVVSTADETGRRTVIDANDSDDLGGDEA